MSKLIVFGVIFIADEPTVALDVTIQAKIQDIMHRRQENMNTSILIYELLSDVVFDVIAEGFQPHFL